MNIFRFILFVSFCAGIQARPFQEWQADFNKRLVTEVLPNGLTVVCFPMPGHTEVRVGITYNVGSKDELPHEHGYAHMVEHMIFKGTETLPETGLRTLAQRYGADRCEGSTTKDLTRYSFTTDRYNYKVFLSMVADCMFNMRCDEQHFASERKTVVEEIYERRDTEVFLWTEALDGLMYAEGHPYRHSLLENEEALLSATVEDLKAFYGRHYYPGNAVLTLLGDIDVEETLAVVRELFSKGERKEHEKLTVDASYVAREGTVSWPLEEEEYFFSWKLPPCLMHNSSLLFLRSVLEARLANTLINRTQLACFCEVLDGEDQLEGRIVIRCKLNDTNDVEEVKDLIHRVIHALGTEGPKDDEVKRFTWEWEKACLESLSSCSAIAKHIEENFFPECMVKTVQDIDTDQAMAFLREYLTPDTMFTLRAVPFSKEEEKIWQQKRTEKDAAVQKRLQQRTRSTDLDKLNFPPHEFGESKVPLVMPYPDKVLTLSNGLTVYLKHRDKEPLVCGTLCFKQNQLFSYAMEQAGKSFIQHCALALLGASTISEHQHEIEDFFQEHKAHYEFSKTNAFFSSYPEMLEQVVQKFVSMLNEPAYGLNRVSCVVQSIAQQLEDFKHNAVYVATQHIKQEVLKEYCALEQASLSFTRDDVVSFYHEYLNPSNMMLYVVGDFESDEIEGILERTFGSWHNAPQCKLITEQVSTVAELPHRVAEDESYPMNNESRVLLMLGRTAECATSKEANCLKLISKYLYNKFFEIRERTGLFYWLSVELENNLLYKKDLGYIYTWVSQHNLDSAEQAMKAMLRTIAEQGISQEVLDAAKNTYRLTLAKTCASNAGFSGQGAHIFSNYGSIEAFLEHVNQTTSLTKEDVDLVVKGYFDPDQWSVVKVGKVRKKGPITRLWHKMKKCAGFFK